MIRRDWVDAHKHAHPGMNHSKTDHVIELDLVLIADIDFVQTVEKHVLSGDTVTVNEGIAVFLNRIGVIFDVARTVEYESGSVIQS